MLTGWPPGCMLLMFSRVRSIPGKVAPNWWPVTCIATGPLGRFMNHVELNLGRRHLQKPDIQAKQVAFLQPPPLLLLILLKHVWKKSLSIGFSQSDLDSSLRLAARLPRCRAYPGSNSLSQLQFSTVPICRNYWPKAPLDDSWCICNVRCSCNGFSSQQATDMLELDIVGSSAGKPPKWSKIFRTANTPPDPETFETMPMTGPLWAFCTCQSNQTYFFGMLNPATSTGPKHTFGSTEALLS